MEKQQQTHPAAAAAAAAPTLSLRSLSTTASRLSSGSGPVDELDEACPPSGSSLNSAIWHSRVSFSSSRQRAWKSHGGTLTSHSQLFDHIFNRFTAPSPMNKGRAQQRNDEVQTFVLTSWMSCTRRSLRAAMVLRSWAKRLRPSWFSCLAATKSNLSQSQSSAAAPLRDAQEPEHFDPASHTTYCM